MKLYTLLFFIISNFIYSQSLETFIKGGELLVTGLSVLKTARTEKTRNANNTFVATVCIKNKLTEKITVKIEGKDSVGAKVNKELIIQNDGKECVFEIPKGIYAFEIILATNEVFKKGEYKFEEEITITINKE